MLWFIHYNHVHTQRDDTYISNVLLKSHAYYSTLKTLNIIMLKIEEAGEEREGDK